MKKIVFKSLYAILILLTSCGWIGVVICAWATLDGYPINENVLELWFFGSLAIGGTIIFNLIKR